MTNKQAVSFNESKVIDLIGYGIVEDYQVLIIPEKDEANIEIS